MRLKTLEIKGFKSFANDTVLHFDEQVIGVVGPNGSGKSNIVDAIRWVLGEQKGKELRLDSMGDVIFNGTKKRKPAPVAQVSITFDNHLGILPSEYHEIRISRHLYRSGESEYRLNGVICRLKDIQSLLIDTGIGSNSYAIIALGMVDDILYDKDNARRRMFEQAAGVSKYKKRKHETLLKLKLTTEDLTRVEDILKEIETNLESLEKQARRTKKYFELKEEYKSLSLSLGARNNTERRGQFAQVERRIQEETDKYMRMEADLDLLHADIEKKRKDHLGDEMSVSTYQKELNELVSLIRNQENDKNLTEQKITFIRQNIANLNLQIQKAGERLESLQTEIVDLTNQYDTQSALLTQHRERLSTAIAQRDEVAERYRSMADKRETSSHVFQQFEKEVYDLEKNIAVLLNNTDILRNENRLLQDEITRLADESAKLNLQLAEAGEKKEAAANALATMEENEMSRLQQIRELEVQLASEMDQLRDVQRSLDARSNEAELLRDMIANLEGFPESIKFLSKAQDWNVAAPLLSDVIYCDQPTRIIVEQILEPYLNYYVVSTWDEAAKAVRLLSFAQKGRANFFIRSAFANSVTTPTQPGLTPLVSMVEIEPGYEHLINKLLHHVYVADGSPLDVAPQDADTLGWVIIDRQAQMIRRKGQLAGGSVGLFEGKKLGRKKHLEHLEEEINELRQNWRSLQDSVQQTQSRLTTLQGVDHSKELQTRRAEVVSFMQTWAELNSRLSHVSERIRDNRQRQEKNLESLREIENKVQDASRLLEEKKAAYRDYAQTAEQTEEQYQEIHRQLNGAESVANELRLEELQMSNTLESLGRELKYHTDQQKQLQLTRDQQLQQIGTETTTLESLTQSLDQLSTSLQQQYEEKKSREEQLTGAEQLYYQQRNEITELENRIKAAEKQRHEQQYLVNDLKDQHMRLKLDLVKISERMEVEFGVRLEDITEEHLQNDMPLEELEEKVERLRKRLENYGEINPMAIEAHEEMKTRYDNINEQRIDILHAKESLLSTIREIEESATTQFLEAFHRVRENFISVFRSLFTEDDTCDLILLNPDDPLESEIDIVAKPKGKRPKSLSQLSGGEKTLTAIALLFALYLMKPAPFCVFDEVDAPLDDANIQKFNKIIKKFSAQSQFIIVTHNKATMAAVDTIYGVYMEEQGVSGLSPVDFRVFAEEDIAAQN